MGNVVEFAGRTAKGRRKAPERPCEITLFPGVRYERHGFEDDRAPLKPDPSRRAPSEEPTDRAV